MSLVSVQPGLTEHLLFRLTVEQFESMIGAGVLTADDSVELIEGVLVRKMPKNPRHTTALMLAVEALKSCIPRSYCVRFEAAIKLESSQPEPDVTVARGVLRDYASRHPGPSDVALVVEVSDSTLEWDRGTKLAMYALSGIRQYWILNLLSRQVEVFTEPDVSAGTYRTTHVHLPGQEVPFLIDGESIRISVDAFLP